MEKRPIEEAPFKTYLEILRKEGYEDDATFTEALYIDLLTTVKSSDGREFTREQIMKAPFRNLVKAAEIIIAETQKELKDNMPERPMPSVGGHSLMGPGADKFTEDQLRHLINRQSQLHEQNKIDQTVGALIDQIKMSGR